MIVVVVAFKLFSKLLVPAFTFTFVAITFSLNVVVPVPVFVTFCEFTVPLNVDVPTPEFTSFNAFPTPTVPVIVELPFNVNVPVLFVPVVVIDEEFKSELFDKIKVELLFKTVLFEYISPLIVKVE